MKKLCLFIIFLSISGFGGEGSSTGGVMLARLGITPDTPWKEINSFDNVLVSYPSVQVKGSYISYDSFCLNEEDILKTGRTKKECVSRDFDGRCDEFKEVELETPRVKEEKKCIKKKWSWSTRKNECVKYENIKKEIPLSTKATLSYFDDARGEEYEGFSKLYEVPDCN